MGEVKAGEVSVISHRGNEIKKTGDESNPAVHIERSGNDVVKKASELNIEEKASATVEPEKKDEDKNMKEKNGDGKENEDEAKAGGKRKAEEQVGAGKKEDEKTDADAKKEDEKDVKKQKVANGASKDAKKGPGRPKSNGEKKPAVKEKKIPAVGKSERKTRSQGSA